MFNSDHKATLSYHEKLEQREQLDQIMNSFLKERAAKEIIPERDAEIERISNLIT